jgi:hypothetical protein
LKQSLKSRPSPIHTSISLFIKKFWTIDLQVKIFCKSGRTPHFDIPTSEERLPNEFVCDSSAVVRIPPSLLSRARGLLERGAFFMLSEATFPPQQGLSSSMKYPYEKYLEKLFFTLFLSFTHPGRHK